jgi:formate hydrogenlyase subunit 3/multisubunit Na+/H+ antiporter MnhD subunit
MISRIVSILRPVCVAATIGLAIVLILCFWGWEIVTWETFWKLFFSYVTLVVGSTLICYIDDPSRITGRRD